MSASAEIFRKILHGLSDRQREAVRAPDRRLRIVAVAGAGKTETIARRMVYFLARGSKPEELVAFTFTERAAKEMKERLYRRAENALGSEICLRLGKLFVGTIHAYCLQILQDYCGFGNHEVLDQNQEVAFALRHGWNLGFEKDKYPERVKTFLSSVSVVNDELLSLKELSKKAPKFVLQQRKYEKLLETHRLLTFGGIIRLAIDHLQSAKALVHGVRHLVVDEYQDINKAQEKLIRLLCKNSTCTVVGDPRQCIYEWRGADSGCFERFGWGAAVKTVPISKNRRSTRSVVSVANAVASHFADQDLRRPMSGKRTEQGVAALFDHETAQDEARWVAQQVRCLVDKRICSYSDIAVLLRSVSTSANEFLEAFKKTKPNIPVLVGGKVGLFRRDEAKALGRLFAWFANMFWRDDRWSPSTEGETLLKQALKLWPLEVNRRKIIDFKHRLRDGGFSNLTSAYQELLLRLGFLSLTPTDAEEASTMANLGRFNRLLLDYEASVRRGGSVLEWDKDLRGLVWFMLTHASGAYEEQPADDLRGIDAVQVMTVHQAKGLEWPIVFAPALVTGRFPSTLAGKDRNFLVPQEMFDYQRYIGGTDSERKIFYVAVTRARDGLSKSLFRSMKKAKKPSIFVEELDMPRSLPSSRPFVSRVHKQASERDGIVTFSPAEIIDYRRCPHFYRLRELWGYQAELVRELGFGKSVHHILRKLADEAQQDGPLTKKKIDSVLQEEFHLPFASPGGTAQILKRNEPKLKSYIEDHKEQLRSVKETEARLEFPLSKQASISGRVDVISGCSDGDEVRDYKTKDDSRTKDEAHFQVRLYVLGLRETGEHVEKGSIGYVMENRDEPVDCSDQKLREARSAAEQAIQAILAGDFPPKPGDHCQNCDYRRICSYRAV